MKWARKTEKRSSRSSTAVVSPTGISGRTPEEEFEYQKYKDNYKKNYALEHGYFYLEIPYWSIDDESYTNLINNKIKEIEKFKNI